MWIRVRSRWSGLWLAGFATLWGCSTEPPFAATDALILTADEARATPVLDSRGQSAAIEAMKMAAPGHRPGRRASAASSSEGGVRWSDVELAVSYACDDAEVAVVETTGGDESGEYRFRIRTVEDWPGEVVVTRVETGEVYRAEVSIGRFPGERRERADRLRAAIDKRMKSFGRKRKYPGD